MTYFIAFFFIYDSQQILGDQHSCFINKHDDLKFTRILLLNKIKSYKILFFQILQGAVTHAKSYFYQENILRISPDSKIRQLFDICKSLQINVFIFFLPHNISQNNLCPRLTKNEKMLNKKFMLSEMALKHNLSIRESTDHSSDK